MTADLLIQNFATLAAAPGGVPKLRELIRSMAVQGQLDMNDPLERSLWKRVPLGDIGEWGSGSTPLRSTTAFYGGTIPWFKSGELRDNVALADAEECVTPLALEQCSLRLCKPGDVLLAMYGATAGKLAILATEATTNQAVCACTCRNTISNRFLFITLLAHRRALIAQGAGAAQPNISKEKIVTTVVALPPLPAQHRIVAKVDELMALCDALEARQEQARKTQAALTCSALHHLTAATDPSEFSNRWKFVRTNFQYLEGRPEHVAGLRRAILQWAVMGKLSAASDWQTIPLAELGSFVGGGTPSKAVGEYWTGNIPWVSPKDMKVTHIADSIDHISPAAVENSSVKLLPPGAILMVVRGMILAHSFPVALTTAPATLNQDMKALVLHEPQNAEYLLMALRGLRDGALALVERSSHGTCRIDTDKLRQFPIPMPPLPEQHRIVAKVDALMKLCDELETGLTRERADADRLFDAVVGRSTLWYAPRMCSMPATDYSPT